MRELTSKEILNLNDHMRKSAEKRAGIDAEKVQKTVSDYLQLARDNHLNYNELQQILLIVKESVLQSLNRLEISALPDTASDTAKQ